MNNSNQKQLLDARGVELQVGDDVVFATGKMDPSSRFSTRSVGSGEIVKITSFQVRIHVEGMDVLDTITRVGHNVICVAKP